MEKNHNISALITLLAGAIAALCCLINRVPILNTLEYVLIVLIIFLVIGRIIEHIIFKINKAAYMAALQAEEEARLAAAAAAEQEEAMAAETIGDGEEVTDDENEEET